MLTKAPFIQARNYSKSSRLVVLGICIHSMEAPEGPKTAENVANWFANQPMNGTLINGKPYRGTSAHWNVDSNSIVQSVREQDVAWHAGPVNNWTIGVEHAGYAKQTTVEWLDKYSMEMLNRSAQLVAEICNRWSIPILKLNADDLRKGKRNGIFGHVDVTMGLTGGLGHKDPGNFFPWQMYLTLVTEHLDKLIKDKKTFKGIVKANVLNVRAAATVEAAIITRLTKGVFLDIIEHEPVPTKDAPKGWFKIQLATGTIGYVSSEHISIVTT